MSVSSNDVCGVGVTADIQITGMCLSKQERQGAPRPSGRTAAPVLVLPQVPPAFQDELSTQTTGVGAEGLEPRKAVSQWRGLVGRRGHVMGHPLGPELRETDLRDPDG